MAKLSEYRLIAEAYDKVYASGANNYPQVLPLLEKGKNLLFLGNVVNKKTFLQELFLILKNFNGRVIIAEASEPGSGFTALFIKRMAPTLRDKVVVIGNPTNQQLIQMLDDNTTPVIYLAEERERFPQVILSRMEMITSTNHPGADKGLISDRGAKERIGRDMDEIRSSFLPR